MSDDATAYNDARFQHVHEHEGLHSRVKGWIDESDEGWP